MTKFKKHTFISMEKIAKIYNAEEVNIHISNSLEDIQNKNGLHFNRENIVKTGYAQYTFINAEDCYFDIKYKNPNYNPALPYTLDNTDSHEAIYLDINQKLTEVSRCIFGFHNPKPKKVKPIYKMTDKFGDVYDGESSPWYGSYELRLIGILLKY